MNTYTKIELKRYFSMETRQRILCATLLLLTLTVTACRNNADEGTVEQPLIEATQGDSRSAVDGSESGVDESNTSAPKQSTVAPSAQVDAAQSVAANVPTSQSGQLARAAQLYNNGDYVAVRRQLADLLNEVEQEDGATRGTSGDVDKLNLYAEANFLLAKSYLANDEYGETLLVLEPVLDELPKEDALRAKMLYLRAEALGGLGRYSEAIADYKAFEGRYPAATQVVQEQIAASFWAAGNLKDAGVAYELAADAASNDAERARLLETLASIYVTTGETDAAIAVYDQILSVARKPAYRAEILFAAGQVLANADEDGAIERWTAAMDEAPDNKYAYLSLIELVGSNAPVDQYLRGYVDLEAGAYLPAIDAFKTFLDEVEPDDKRAGQATHYLGQSYLEAGNYEVANQLFEQVIEIYPDCTCFGQAWLDLAESQAWLGDGSQARRTYRTFAREHGGDELAPEALWRSGLLAFNEGSQLEVAVDFFALSDDFSESERAPLALYIVGIGAYREGLHGQAVRVYERMQEKHASYRADAVGYWLGRAYFDSGEADKARAAWRSVADEIPDTFYGILSALAVRKPGQATNTLAGIDGIAGPASTIKGDDGSQAFAEKWLAQWLKAEDIDVDGVDLAKLPANVDQDVDLQTGRLMLELDQRFEALAALERVYDRYGETPSLLYPLSLEFERLGAYRLSLISMEWLIQLSPAELVEDTPIFFQRYIYPRRYPDLVEKAARKNDIDPLLYYSLIRQESLFEKGARSYAAAQGLAQIIPDTATWIAERVAYPNFSNDLVYRPHINLDFGAYYLDWARDFLDDNLISALVGYNAGPGNSLEWRKISGVDDALFVEILSVNEPRLYILKITSNYYHYNRLYSE